MTAPAGASAVAIQSGHPPSFISTRAAETNRERLAVWLVALAGVALIAWQYFAAPSLWLDELALVRNIIDRPWGELLSQPLDYAQVAPPGFLALEKLAFGIFGDSERALRAVPFVFAVAGLLVFTSIALRVLTSRGALVAVSIVAFSSRLIWNGAQVKQYASDVFVAVGLIWLVLWLSEAMSRRRAAVAAALGAVSAFISQPAAFVLTAGAVVLLLSLLTDTDPARRRQFGAVSIVWVTAAGVAGLLARATVSPDTLTFMRDFWEAGFPPIPPRSLADLLWPWRALTEILATVVNASGYAAYAAFALLGAIVLLWRHRVAIMIVGAVALAVSAAVLRLFPFTGRPAIFAVPLLALACGAGAEAVGNLVLHRSRLLAWAVPLVLFAVPLRTIVRRPPVFRVQEARPLLEWVGTLRRPGDATYAFYGAWQAVRHYGPKTGLDTLLTAWGECHRGLPRDYFREVDQFRGKPRVWLVFTHAEPRYSERDAILGYLDSIGVRREFKSIPDPYVPSVASADAHLYDLSDPARLGRTDAEHAALPAGSERAPAEGCHGPFMRQP